jgi:hypothetical protein
MGHIHTNDGEHDHTASAYIVRTDASFDEPRLMLHRHRKLGVYLQFGGHIELTETPWQAVLHELAEESGYRPNELKLVQPTKRITHLDDAVLHPVPFCHNTHNFDAEGQHRHSDIGYLFVADRPPLHPVNDGESEDIVLLSGAELAGMKSPEEIYRNIQQIGSYALGVVSELGERWELVDLAEFH